MSKDAEINGIIGREDLILKLEERKRAIEDSIELQRHADGSFDETIQYDEVYSPTLPTPTNKHDDKEKIANGRLKNAETHLEECAREYIFFINIKVFFLLIQFFFVWMNAKLSPKY